MKRLQREKWQVFGEYGGTFTNLDDARKCAKYASTTEEHDYSESVYNLDDGTYYIDYENGKCVRDGWTRPALKRTGRTAKFNLDGNIVEKSIYLLDDKQVVRHNNKIYVVNDK